MSYKGQVGFQKKARFLRLRYQQAFGLSPQETEDLLLYKKPYDAAGLLNKMRPIKTMYLSQLYELLGLVWMIDKLRPGYNMTRACKTRRVPRLTALPFMGKIKYGIA